MARQVSRISDLPTAEPLEGDELLEIVQGGENVRVRADEFVHSGGGLQGVLQGLGDSTMLPMSQNAVLDSIAIIPVRTAYQDIDDALIAAPPEEGSMYIVPPYATGAWTGQDHKIARWVSGAWEFYTPKIGTFARTNTFPVNITTFRWNGTIWDVASENLNISFALIKMYTEKVSNIASGTISRYDGAWQVLTLTASEELDVSALTAGQSVTITVVGGDEYALTYAGVDRWSGAGQPTELLPTHDLTFAHNGVESIGFDLGGTDAV